MARRKKYELLSDTMNEFNISVIEELENDLNNGRKLVQSTYTLTTSGGDSCLWQVNDPKKGIFFTVSTGVIRRERVNRFVQVPVYKHYVLTEQGMKHMKNLVVMNKL